MNFELKAIKHILELESLRKGITHNIDGHTTIGYGLRIEQSKYGRWHNKMLFQKQDLSKYTTHELSYEEAYKLLEKAVKNLSQHLLNVVGSSINKLNVSQAAGIVTFLYHVGSDMENLYALLANQKFAEAGLLIASTRHLKVGKRVIPVHISWRIAGSYHLVSQFVSRKNWKNLVSDLPPINENENLSKLLYQHLPKFNTEGKSFTCSKFRVIPQQLKSGGESPPKGISNTLQRRKEPYGITSIIPYTNSLGLYVLTMQEENISHRNAEERYNMWDSLLI